MNRLYRSRSDAVIAGVCGGLGHYFNIDPVVVRLGWVLFTLFGGAGVLGYLLAWVIVPDEYGRRASLPVILLVALFVVPFTCLWCALLPRILFGLFSGH